MKASSKAADEGQFREPAPSSRPGHVSEAPQLFAFTETNDLFQILFCLLVAFAEQCLKELCESDLQGGCA